MVPIQEQVTTALNAIVKALEAEARQQVEAAVTNWSADWIRHHTKPPSAVHGVLRIATTKGEPAMGLTVDTTPGSESVDLGFEDDHGNATGAPAGDGSGLVVTFASSDSTLATVGEAVQGTDGEGNTTYSAPITVVTTVPSETGVSFSVGLANASGAPLTEGDGVTPFPTVAPSAAVPITAGEAVEGTLSVAPTA